LVGEGAASRVYLTVGIPVDQVFAPVMAVERGQLLGLLVAIALAATGAWFVGERMVVRRVDAIIRATREIGLGHLAARTGVPAAEDELARLAREFDMMADQLEAREGALLEATTELRRVNRALTMLSACNQVMIRATDENAMAQQISETIVGQGGFRLAWVALAEPESRHKLRILGRAGAATAYLDEIPLDWSEDPSRQGPGATAIRTEGDDGRSRHLDGRGQSRMAPPGLEIRLCLGDWAAAAAGGTHDRGPLPLRRRARSIRSGGTPPPNRVGRRPQLWARDTEQERRTPAGAGRRGSTGSLSPRHRRECRRGDRAV